MSPRAPLVLLVALGLLALPAGAGGLALDDPAATPKPLRLALDGVEEIPLHAPTPETAVGIGPGSHLLISMAGGTYGCTANFVWQGANGKLYLGSAGHCFLPEGKAATHGPGADYNPSGTTVRVCVAQCSFGGMSGFIFTGQLVTLGPVAYARQTQGGIDVGNDFGIVEIPASLHAQIRPHMPVFRGPTSWQDVGPGKLLCHYGAGVGYGEYYLTQGRMGVGTDIAANRGAWYSAAGAAPGDSGSGIQVCGVSEEGVHGVAAAGVITHLVSGWVAGTTIPKAKAMVAQAGLTIDLVYEA